MIEVTAALASAANSVYRRFSGYVDREDLVSEGWVWVLEHKVRMDEYDKDENAKRADYRFRRDVSIAMEKFARKEKSIKVGYDPSDEAFYNQALIAVMLPAVVDGVYEPSPGIVDGSSTRQDPAEGGTWQAARADVAAAWEAAPLSVGERSTLRAYYVDGYSEEEIASWFDLTQQTISKRIKSGIRKIVNELGGEKPKGCPYDCECHEAKLRLRPGMNSNMSGQNQSIG